MTNEEAFEKAISELDFQDIAHDTESIRNLYKRGWDLAIAYMQEQSEPVAEVIKSGNEVRIGVIKLEYWGNLPVGTRLYTTPQRQKPLKRLSDEQIGELMRGDNGFCSEEFANAIMDKMQEINK